MRIFALLLTSLALVLAGCRADTVEGPTGPNDGGDGGGDAALDVAPDVGDGDDGGEDGGEDASNPADGDTTDADAQEDAAPQDAAPDDAPPEDAASDADAAQDDAGDAADADSGDSGPVIDCTNLTQDGDETDIDCGGSCDPCSLGQGCEIHADCVSLNCDGEACVQGEAEPGTACADDSECASGDCHDFGGTSVCTADCSESECPAGMACFEDLCTPVDYCDTAPDPDEGPGCPGSGCASCDDHAYCVEQGDGSFECECVLGYTGDGSACSAADECDGEGGGHDCVHPTSCVDLAPDAGRFSCDCIDGQVGDGHWLGTGCTNVDECADESANDCVDVATCEDRVPEAEGDPRYDCDCPSGWEGDGFEVSSGGTGCTGPCELGTDDCDDAPAATCTDITTPPGYECTCPDGSFLGEGNQCLDEDECDRVPAPCDPNATCINQEGSYDCECNDGYCGGGGPGDCAPATVSGDPAEYCDGYFPTSCQEYRFPGDSRFGYAASPRVAATTDGDYRIQPDPDRGDLTPRTVSCDMTTDGGGWTRVDREAAKNTFGGTLGTLEGTCGFDEDGIGITPYGLGVGNLNVTCRYDIPLGFTFNTVRTDDVTVEARATGIDTADLTVYSQASWATGYCPGSFRGDFTLGSPAHAGPVLSLGRYVAGLVGLPLTCGTNLGDHPSGTDLPVSGSWSAEANTTAGTVLRLQFGEAGPETEGWAWIDGSIWVRQEVELVGDLGSSGPTPPADPVSWADGTLAESCEAYRRPADPLYAYHGSGTGNGWYLLEYDTPGGTETEPYYCDMKTSYGGVIGGITRVVYWPGRGTRLDDDADEIYSSMPNISYTTANWWTDYGVIAGFPPPEAQTGVLALGFDVEVPNGGEVGLEVNYQVWQAWNLDGSGTYFYVRHSSGALSKMLCHSTEDIDNFPVSERGYRPSFADSCGSAGPGDAFTWRGDAYDFSEEGGEVDEFRLHSLHYSYVTGIGLRDLDYSYLPAPLALYVR